MPDGLEHLIRPYQSPNAHGKTVIPSTPQGTQERAHLTWGGKGTMPEMHTTGLDFNTKKPVPKEEKLTEKERKSDTVRITQEGKPENYVDVKRAREIKLSKESDQFYLDESAYRSFVESAIDARLNSYKARMSNSDPTVQTMTRAMWIMQNEP